MPKKEYKDTILKRYVKINGATFKIELVEGTPPRELVVATPTGILALKTAQTQKLNSAYANKDIEHVFFKNLHIEV